MDVDSEHTFRDGRGMRFGHTTGTCAAAASKAAVMMLLSQRPVDRITIMTPKGMELELEVEDAVFSNGKASCAIRKDGGDDADCTHGTLIYSDVSLAGSGVNIDGGIGIGRITCKGLDQPVGNAAINHVPRKMIAESVRSVCDAYGYDGGVDVMISAPDGSEIAKHTFNPRLGIIGGISILGTSGIVEPMSEKAMIDTMRVEAKVRLASGMTDLLFVPGNYGKEFLRLYPRTEEEDSVKCSNFIGEALDTAVEFGARSAVIVGNIGKLVKIAGGMMNTHSKYGDCRMEILASCFITSGGNVEDVKNILNSVTTDDALDTVHEAGLMEDTMRTMMERIAFNLDRRVHGRIETGAVVFSTKYGKLCETGNANELITRMKK